MKKRHSRRKKEKQEKLERKIVKEKNKLQAVSAAAAGKKPARVVGAKRNPEVDGPAKPPKPFVSRETIRIFNLVRDGNENIHIYDPVLAKYKQIREKVEIESTQKGIKRW